MYLNVIKAIINIINKKVIVSLIECGAFNEFNINKKMYIENIDEVINYATLCKDLSITLIETPIFEEIQDFTDKEQKAFMLNSTPDGSFVLPAAPFSIVDKVKHLKSAGFNKVLIDFSKVKVTRNQIKAIMSSMNKGQPLPNVSRFNWKDGFYSRQQMEEYKAANERALQRKQSGKGSAAQGRFKNKSSRRRK